MRDDLEICVMDKCIKKDEQKKKFKEIENVLDFPWNLWSIKLIHKNDAF